MLQSIGWQRVQHNSTTEQRQQIEEERQEIKINICLLVFLSPFFVVVVCSSYYLFEMLFYSHFIEMDYEK